MLPALPASANIAGTGLVISEVYGAGGNAGATYTADFVELYNPTAAPISLAGTAIQYRSSGGTAAVVPYALTGIVPAGHHFLIQMSAAGANGVALPTPDAVASPAFAMAAGSGQVLFTTTTSAFVGSGDVAGIAAFLDMVGYGTGVTTYEGAITGVPLTATTSAQRAGNGADTDNNANDFSEVAPVPQNSASDAPAGPTVGAVSDKTFTLDVAITPFTVTATGGAAPYTWSATGLPAGLALDPSTGEVSGTPTATGVASVTVTATDTTNATGSKAFSITVNPAAATITPIADIQGTDATQGAGAASPLVGTTVTTQGVVTGLYTATGSLNGIYLQTGGTGGPADASPGASDGIFVFGSNAAPAGVVLGDSVEVTGPVSEFFGLTEITPASGGVTELGAPLSPVTALAAAYPTTTLEREAHEGELLAPTDTFTVTNSFATNQFAEIGLATGDHPLVQPTEVVPDDDAAGITAIKADNAARAVSLDDGAGLNFLSAANQGTPLPWLTPTSSVRVGATATFHQPVILDFRNSTWKFQPNHQVTDQGTDVVTFGDTRTPNLAPASVGGNLKLATFNVQNFFDTTGQDYVSYGGTCSYFNDRAGTPIATNTCTSPTGGSGVRGAATTVSLQRQRAKIVTAINSLGADIVSLEEVENTTKIAINSATGIPGSPLSERWRDEALANLVDALNAAAGPGTWAFVASPTESTVAANISASDVIRTAFIYKRATVVPVGMSDIYFAEPTDTAFANAREPMAQVFKPKGHPNSDGFAVVVNHFKSKGDSTPPAIGDNANSVDTGAFNGDRTRQATAVAAFANQFAAAHGVAKIFLTGDFNAYTHEDPVLELIAKGFTPVESNDPKDESYSFSGLSGSLDHVFANAAAMNAVTGADVWEINANEPIAYNFSRFNYNATDFFDPSTPFAASDHNPEIVGIDAGAASGVRDIQIVATNDFHGRLQNNTGNTEAGAAVLAGAVKQLRAQNPNTVFAAAGDLIGASTFESFIQEDKPTIDALNEAGLEVSAVGNHELDKGKDDLLNRVMAAYDPVTNKYGGAHWQYISANLIVHDTSDPLVPSTWMKDMDGVKVGFVGAVTEDLPSLVSPDGLAGIDVTDIVSSVNTAAAELKTAGADIVVLLVHEGAPGTDCAQMDDDPTSAFGSIVTQTSPDVDAIISGHTHLEYSCSFPVQQWIDQSRAITQRPVLSAGQYGMAMDQLVYTVDASDNVTAVTFGNVDLKGSSAAFNFPADSATAQIVADAVTAAGPLGSVVLGKLAGPLARAKFAGGTLENRGGESTLGNLVAEVQRWATPADTVGAAQIAFMNPGGLRADMVGTGTGPFPRDLTYRQAANVQPFANTLVNMDLTGAQIKKVLEQQWQRTAAGAVPSRAFLKLGISRGFTYTYHLVDDPALPGTPKGVIDGIWLNGVALDPTASYSVTVNSFLAAGGDNFRELANGTTKQDTGMTDLQAMVDYMAQFGGGTGLPVDYRQQAVNVTFPAGAPASYHWGDTIAFDLASLSMTDPSDVKDAQVEVKLGNTVLGTFPVTTTLTSSPDGSAGSNDEAGTANVSVTLPDNTASGVRNLTVTGLTTGTTTTVPVTVAPPAPASSTVAATADPITYGVNGSVHVTVTSANPPTGDVSILDGGTVVGTGTLSGGEADITIPGTALEVGGHSLTVSYAGSSFGGDVINEPASTTLFLNVVKAVPVVSAVPDATSLVVDQGTTTIPVTVTAPGFVPTGVVIAYVDGQAVSFGILDGGAATLTVGPFDTVGPEVVTVKYFGDDHTTVATKNTAAIDIVKASSTVTGNSPTIQYGKGGSLTVTVSSTGSKTGTVEVREGTTLLGSITLAGGTGTLPIPAKSMTVGTHSLVLSYLGDAKTEGSSGGTTVTVTKQKPKLGGQTFLM